MRGRPRKTLDFQEIARLSAQGQSARAIAQHLTVSRMTINRILCQLRGGTKLVAQNSSTTIKSGTKIEVAQNSQGGTKFIYDDKVEKHGGTKFPLATSAPMTTTITPPACGNRLDTGVAHKCLFVVAYQGSQPVSLVHHKFGNNDSCIEYRFDVENAVFLITTHKVKAYLRGITGDSSDEMKARARGRVRYLLGSQFAEQHNIKILWDTIELKSELDINLTPPYKKTDVALQEIVKQEPDKAKEQLGMVAGDFSHPEQIEFVGKKGQESFDRFVWLQKNAPELLIGLVNGQKAMNTNLDTLMESTKSLINVHKERETMIDARFTRMEGILSDLIETLSNRSFHRLIRET